MQTSSCVLLLQRAALAATTGKNPCLCRHASTCQVVYMEDNLAILSGLNLDAPLGTKIAFVTGGTG